MRGGDRADAVREQIAARSDLNAFISLTTERGSGPIVAVKDLIDVRGRVTTGGGPADGLSPATEDAPAIKQLRRTGAVVIGKTNLYEWGYGVSSENVNHGPVLNPTDPSRSAGGSSSGSAAAVAAGLCDCAIGTDTAGSVRIPASLCGVVGFKPSRGRIPLGGVVQLSPSQDTIGVLAPSVVAAFTGASALEARIWPSGGKWRSSDGLRLAVPEGWVEDLDPQTAEAWDRTAAALPEVPFVDRQRLFRLAEIVQAYEAIRVHRDDLERNPDRYRPEVRERLARGERIERPEYREALGTVRELSVRADAAMEGWDAFLLPTTARVAPLLDEPEPREALTRFTRPFNATGQPVFTLPLPTSGLPVGLQIVGRYGHDARLAQVAGLVGHTIRSMGSALETNSSGRRSELHPTSAASG